MPGTNSPLLNACHCMVDIETLDTSPTAIILQIGACIWDNRGLNARHFDPSRLGLPVFGERISLFSYKNRKEFTISPQTVAWWMNSTSEAARKSVFGNPNSSDVPLSAALRNFKNWYEGYTPDYIWCRGAGFDTGCLKHAMEVYSISCPWQFRQEMDLRTVLNVAGLAKPEENAIRISFYEKHHYFLAHDALQDAIYQMWLLCEVLGRAIYWTPTVKLLEDDWRARKEEDEASKE